MNFPDPLEAQLMAQFLAQTPRQLWPSGTWANRPSNGSLGLYFATDIGGGALLRDNGTRWVPVSGRLVVRNVTTDITLGATTSESVLDAWTPPAGFFDENATLTVEIRPQTSANTNAKRYRIRGDGTGTNGFELSLINANSSTGVSGFYIFGFSLRNSLTTVLGNGAGTTGQSATANQTPGAGMNFENAVPIYLTAQKDVSGDTVGVRSVRWIYEKGASA